MKRSPSALLPILFLASCGAQQPVASNQDAPRETAVQHEPPPPCAPRGEVQRFDPDNIWDAINGAADLYLEYGFRELAIQEYQCEDVRVSVETYDQGAPINAFGIYRRSRPPDAIEIRVGAEAAVAPPYHCMMFKQQRYFRAQALEGELSEPLCRGLLESIAKNTPGDEHLPEDLDRLPRIHRVDGSEGFTPKSYLGTEDLARCLHARYKGSDDLTYEVFTIIEESNQTWERLSAKWTNARASDAPALYRDIPYRGVVVVTRSRRGILGVVDAGDLPAATAVLQQAAESLN